MKTVYLDNAATTLPWPEVKEAMMAAMVEGIGNAASIHRWGVRAARLVEESAESISAAVGSGPWRVIFTSGGTEADNLAILGSAPKGRRTKLVTTSLEHAAVTEACIRAAGSPENLITVSGGRLGIVQSDEMLANVDDRTATVSMVHVASEIGTVQPVGETATSIKAMFPKCRFHVDAVQALPQWVNLAYPKEVDMVSISAHKIHGPLGIGALLVRPEVHLQSILCGGDQQQGIRPGTLNVPAIVGFALAAKRLQQTRTTWGKQLQDLGERLVTNATQIPGVRLLGDPLRRAPGIAVLAVKGTRSEILLHQLEEKGIIASSSSACHATRTAPPTCLIDAGLRPNEGALRFSMSADTQEEDIDTAVQMLQEILQANE